jgi:hypothetical protein
MSSPVKVNAADSAAVVPVRETRCHLLNSPGAGEVALVGIPTVMLNQALLWIGLRPRQRAGLISFCIPIVLADATVLSLIAKAIMIFLLAI